MASVLVPEKAAADRIGLRSALGIEVSPDAPRAAALRAREADLVEASCRARLGRLPIAHVERLGRILGGGATRLGPIVEAAMVDRARLGLSGDDRSGPSPTRDDTGAAAPMAFGPTLQEAKERTPVSERAVIDALGPGGAVGGALAGFQVRPGQVRMARAVTRALNDSLRVLVEAGTGTGKSLAYLVPAAIHAVQNGRRVVISTHTIALQDQLITKDVPVLRRALTQEVHVAVLKGRSHYLCLRRWRRFLSAGLSGESERVLAARIATWLLTTETGDRNEMALDEGEMATWSAQLGADVLHCTGRLCADNRAGRCWVARARRRAAASHLVIVNHALLLTDLATTAGGERGVLPEYAEAIIDEAHHLEAVATDHLGAEVATRDLVTALNGLSSPLGGGRFGGSVGRLAAVYVEVGGQFARDTVGPLTAEIHASIEAAQRSVGPFRDALLGVVQVNGRGGSGDGDREVRLVPDVRSGDAWETAEAAWEALSAALGEGGRTLRRLVEAFDPHVGASEAVDDAVAELAEAIAMLAEVRSVVARIIETPSDSEVSWIAVDRAGFGRESRELRLHAAPLEVDRHLQAMLFEGLQAVVLTSATIQVDGSFRHARTRLGLGSSAHVLAVESPFDYPSQALLVVPRDLPDPASPASAAVLHEILAGIAEVMGGRTMALFTSHAGLRAAHAAISEALPNLVVLGQGIDGSRTTLLERFRATPNAILLGTSSFWEGIDVTGDALSCLVIQKLPFTVPTDPVFAARSERLADPFGELAVPQAVVRLRQGFGRLIRTTTDRGVAVVLDSRLVTKGYGRTFLDSLPPASRRVCTAREVVPTVREWWGDRGATI